MLAKALVMSSSPVSSSGSYSFVGEVVSSFLCELARGSAVVDVADGIALSLGLSSSSCASSMSDGIAAEGAGSPAASLSG